MQAFSASERMARLGEETIYVRLTDGRGWVFESLDGTRVLERVTPSSIKPPTPPSPQASPTLPPNLRKDFRSETGKRFSTDSGSATADVVANNLNGKKS